MTGMEKEKKRYRQRGESVVLYPANYINDIEGEKLEEMCGFFLNRGCKKVVMDFSETDLINSIGVSILIGIIEQIREKDGEIHFCGLKQVNYDIFNMVGLTRHIKVFRTEDDAVRGIRSGNGQLLM